MSRPHRITIAVRAAAAIEVEALPLPYATDSLTQAHKAFLSQVRHDADCLLGVGEERFREHVRSLSDKIGAYPFDTSIEGIDRLTGARDRLLSRLETACPCIVDPDVCSCLADGPSEDAPVSAPCMCEIRELMKLVEAHVRAGYKSCFADLPDGPLRLVTQRTDAPPLYGDPPFAVTGFTQVDASDAPAIVGLALVDQNFDWRALCQTLYVFAHEIVCHAFQGCRGNNRIDADEKCAWSEGWMDTLAWNVTEHCIRIEAGNLPAWLKPARCRDTAESSCRSLYEARYQAPQPSLDRVHVERRTYARHAFLELNQALGGGGSAPHWSGNRAAAFSLRLNLCDLGAGERDMIQILLSQTLLDLEDPVRFESAVAACSEFCRHQNTDRLMMDLEDC